MAVDVTWSARQCAIDARLELEHHLGTYVRKFDVDLVSLTAERSDARGKTMFCIQFQRSGAHAVMTPWREVHGAPRTVPPNAVEYPSRIGATEFGSTCDVELAVVFRGRQPADSENEARLLARACALLSVITFDDERIWLHESQRANCFFTLLQCVLRRTQAASAIIWFTRIDPGSNGRGLSALAVAGFRTRRNRGLPPLNSRFGRGVVGRAAETGQILAVPLGNGGVEVMNPDLVRAEGWASCVAIPLLFDSECVGVLSIYDRTNVLDAAVIVEALLGITPVATLSAARASRDLRRKAEADNMMTGAMRLQAGLAMVGLVHDLARHARDVNEWAESLREPLKEISLKAGIPQTIDDMITSADLVGKLTTAMDKLALGRDDRLVQVDIAERLSELEAVLKRLDSRIEVHIEGNASVRGPSSLVERLVFNLVVNSLHWTARENRKIEVYFRCGEGQQSVAVLGVKDNGQGMTPEQLAHVREAFVSFRENGSGLGLFLVDTLCKQVGARLRIASEPYQSTTVEMIFEKLEG